VRPEDAARLRAALGPSADVLTGDGWENAARLTPRAPGAALVLVDPPFEAPDDGERAARLARRVLARNAGARLAVWAPIKDLASFDTLVGAIEDAVGDHPLVVLECRLRPPNDPLRLNGCAMIVVHPSAGLQARAASAAAWLAGNFGDGAPRL
jgi:23S rRNA (adenine2030-N6)-methyltransferase